MVLSKIKTNIQKRETKDQPQTNGSYKIRQTIIKIMKYTYIHIFTPMNKVKTVQQQKKVQQVDLVNKVNQKLYLPVKNKLTKAQTGKQN